MKSGSSDENEVDYREPFKTRMFEPVASAFFDGEGHEFDDSDLHASQDGMWWIPLNGKSLLFFVDVVQVNMWLGSLTI
jgi:hypothetical protein